MFFLFRFFHQLKKMQFFLGGMLSLGFVLSPLVFADNTVVVVGANSTPLYSINDHAFTGCKDDPDCIFSVSLRPSCYGTNLRAYGETETWNGWSELVTELAFKKNADHCSFLRNQNTNSCSLGLEVKYPRTLVVRPDFGTSAGGNAEEGVPCDRDKAEGTSITCPSAEYVKNKNIASASIQTFSINETTSSTASSFCYWGGGFEGTTYCNKYGRILEIVGKSTYDFCTYYFNGSQYNTNLVRCFAYNKDAFSSIAKSIQVLSVGGGKETLLDIGYNKNKPKDAYLDGSSYGRVVLNVKGSGALKNYKDFILGIKPNQNEDLTDATTFQRKLCPDSDAEVSVPSIAGGTQSGCPYQRSVLGPYESSFSLMKSAAYTSSVITFNPLDPPALRSAGLNYLMNFIKPLLGAGDDPSIPSLRMFVINQVPNDPTSPLVIPILDDVPSLQKICPFDAVTDPDYRFKMANCFIDYLRFSRDNYVAKPSDLKTYTLANFKSFFDSTALFKSSSDQFRSAASVLQSMEMSILNSYRVRRGGLAANYADSQEVYDQIKSAICGSSGSGGIARMLMSNSANVATVQTYLATLGKTVASCNLTTTLPTMCTAAPILSDYNTAMDDYENKLWCLHDLALKNTGGQDKNVARIANLYDSAGNSTDPKPFFDFVVNFPGSNAQCGSYYSPLMFFFDKKYPDFSGTSFFPLYGMGKGQAVFWPEAGNQAYFLALPNKAGKIAGHEQLFGQNKKFANGFDALKIHDSNNDLRIDSKDKVFKRLILWNDANGDGIPDAKEFIKLKDKGITSIDLNYSVNNRSMFAKRRAQAKEKSIFTYSVNSKEQLQGEVFDVWIAPFPYKMK